MVKKTGTLAARTLSTDRLELTPCTLALATAEMKDKTELSKLLNADVPNNWPPPLNDEKSLQWTIDSLSMHPDDIGWFAWYMLVKNGGRGKRSAIGIGGFRGAPSADGSVEIGYSIMEKFQGKGYAT